MRPRTVQTPPGFVLFFYPLLRRYDSSAGRHCLEKIMKLWGWNVHGVGLKRINPGEETARGARGR